MPGDEQVIYLCIIFCEYSLKGSHYSFDLPTNRYNEESDKININSVVTPMPCKIANVFVKVGQHVKKDDPLIILEAMKMEVKELFFSIILVHTKP
jgi:acetyl/propionyl-CoA carboxylase alpha subunit